MTQRIGVFLDKRKNIDKSNARRLRLLYYGNLLVAAAEHSRNHNAASIDPDIVAPLGKHQFVHRRGAFPFAERVEALRTSGKRCVGCCTHQPNRRSKKRQNDT